MAGLIEDTSDAVPSTPPEPNGGLAHEKELETKLTNAAERTRRRNAAIAQANGGKSALRRAVERELESHGVAPERGPVGRIPLEEGDRPESAATKERRRCLIPERFERATFDTFEPVSPSQLTALEAVRRWSAKALTRSGPMLALIGTQGTGKSHLLYAAVSQLLELAQDDVYARAWYRLADELRYGGPSVFAPHLRDEPHEVRDRLWKHRIVFLDEVRPTASTAFDDTELAKFACHAYDARVAVLITTNVDPLSDVMGAAAASRFTQVVITGPDRRQA